MKKFLALFFLGFLAFLTASCFQPEIEEQPLVAESGETVFTATLVDTDTKAVFQEDNNVLHVLWSKKDNISLYYGGKHAKFTSSNTVSSTTEFTGTLPVITEPFNDLNFYAIFPYRGSGNYYEYNNGSPLLIPQLNSTQAYAIPNSFSYSSSTSGTGAVFVGRSSTHSINFYNICAFLRFKVTEEDVRAVEFTSQRESDKEQICGLINVSFDGNDLPHVNYNAGYSKNNNIDKSSVKLSCPNNAPFEKNVWYYIALFPAKFEQGAQVTVYTSTGYAVRKIKGTTDNPLTFDKGTYRSIASIDHGGDFHAQISSQYIQQDGKTITETTLWPRGTTTLTACVKGPNNVISSDLNWTWTSSIPAIAEVSSEGVVTGKAAGETVITATTTIYGTPVSTSVTVSVTEASSQLAPKLFTVDNNHTQVYFSTGNLYTSDGEQFSFNTYQGQIVSYDQPSWVTTGGRDKFSWNEWKNITSAENVSTTNTYSIYKETQDLSGLSGWSMPTYPQWEYLLMSRKNSEGQDINRFAKATINGIPGLLLFPDEYVHPNGIAALANVNTKDASFSSNMFYGSDWVCMEDNGVVFLPSAGMTNETWSGNSSVYTNGFYWSSCLKVTSGVEKSPIRLRFYSGVDTYSTNANNQYLSIRLVRPVTE